MEPLTIDRTHILVLNYNGRRWLEECLPTILEAADRSPVPCAVTVVDNSSTDGSCERVVVRWPTVGLVREENLGLASFNRVLARLEEPVVLLLNNDIKLDPGAVGLVPQHSGGQICHCPLGFVEGEVQSGSEAGRRGS